MTEPLDARLRDDDALAEIDLASRLMIAASGASEKLSQAEVDELLGVGLQSPA
ncbi:MAG: hypothetical protein GX678_00930 [Actinomycetales bacterium]|nr:hypothetical protein [Actinomycetales bacterium]